MRLQLAVRLERDRHRPGDTVAGVVRVLEGGNARELRLSPQFLESVPSFSFAARRLRPVVLHSGDLAAGDAHPFSFTLPVDALPDCRSPHGSVAWVIDIRVDRVGPDHHEVHGIGVSLGG